MAPARGRLRHPDIRGQLIGPVLELAVAVVDEHLDGWGDVGVGVDHPVSLSHGFLSVSSAGEVVGDGSGDGSSAASKVSCIAAGVS